MDSMLLTILRQIARFVSRTKIMLEFKRDVYFYFYQVYFAGLIKKPLVSTPRSYENVGRPKKDFGQFEEMCRSTKHTAALELKSVAKSSKLLLYSAKLAMDDNGDKAASKVLNELYTDPCGNSAELLLSNSGLLLSPEVRIVARAVLGLSGFLMSSLEESQGIRYDFK